ncbi:MAG: zf-HC2 domain-containing protein [Candidatus Poribacteria bacterium]|nr:zf-HC2 domain-containing protein [Candidatus Poribacteria bacterium]MDE0503172.1 zf-HC2 domain-containing protein [Candidatus Poribacteria bacterium]
MQKCEGIQSEISAYLDRELPLWKSQLIKRHLRQCSTCAREVMRIRQTDGILHRLDPVKTSDDFVSDVMNRASEVCVREKLRTSPFRRICQRFEAAMAWRSNSVLKRAPSVTFAAAFALLLVLGTFATVYFPHGMRLSSDNAQLVMQPSAEEATLVWIDIIPTSSPKRYLSIHQRSAPHPTPSIGDRPGDSRQL